MLTDIRHDQRVIRCARIDFFNQCLRVDIPFHRLLLKRTAEGFNFLSPRTVILLLHRAGQQRQNRFQITAQMIASVKIFIHFRRVNINVQDFRIRRKLKTVTCHAV